MTDGRIPMKYIGSFERLCERLAPVLGDSEWRTLNGGAHRQLRTPCGAVVNYWPSTGTLLCQGKPEAAEAMHNEILKILLVDALRSAAGQYEDENEWWETGL